jgi:sulfite reductase beta subunit-like hemoprotein
LGEHFTKRKDQKMTRREFEQSVARLIRQPEQMSDDDVRVFTASGFIIRQRRGIADDEMTKITRADVAVFLATLDPERMRKLKKIADDLIEGGVSSFH